MHVKATTSSRLSETDQDSDEERSRSTNLAELLCRGKHNVVLTHLEQVILDRDALMVEYEGQPLLHWAVANGHDDVIAQWLARPELALDCDTQMRLALTAIKRYRLSILKLLVVATPAVLTTPARHLDDDEFLDVVQGDSLAHVAARVRANTELSWLVAHYPSFLAAQNQAGATPLLVACGAQNMGGALLLVSAGADVHVVDNDGNTVLHAAIASMDPKLDDHVAFVSRLLVRCYSVSLAIRNADGLCASEYADESDDMLTLLEKETELQTSYPLHCIARCNDASAFQTWLSTMLGPGDNDKKGQVDAIATALSVPDMDGKTVAMHAVEAIDSTAPVQVADLLLRYCTRHILTLQDMKERTVMECLLEKDLVCTENLDGATNEAALKTLQLLIHIKRLPLDYTRNTKVPQQGAPPRTCAGICLSARRASDANLARLAAEKRWVELQRQLDATSDMATINDFDAHGRTALHYVCAYGHDGLLAHLLLQTKLDIAIKTRLTDQSALFLAFLADHAACVRLLLQAGAHHELEATLFPAQIEQLRQEAVANMYASQVLRCDSWNLERTCPEYHRVRLLSVNDAEQCLQAKKTALHIATEKQLPTSIVEQLLATKRSDVNAQSTEGTSALMLAAAHGNMTHLALLLRHGAELDLVDTNDSTAVLHAAVHGHLDVVELLLVRRADLDPKQDGRPIVERLRAILRGTLNDEHTPILQLLEKEERARDNSQEFRDKRALAMITKTTDDVFADDNFSQAIRCNTTLGPTFLDDCVSLSRHEATFSNLLLVYGKSVQESPLRAVLQLNLSDPDATFATQQACLEHPAFHRVLEIKWILFGRRLYLQQLLMNLLLLVAMTTSSILPNDELPPPIVYNMGISTLIFVAVGLLVVQCLRPQVLAAYARLSDNKSLFDGGLVLLAVVGTVLLVVPVLYASQELRIVDWFTPCNNLVLALSTLYFLHIELQEMRVSMDAYLSSTMNRVQLMNYTVILCVFVPIQVGWISVSDDVQVGLGAVLTLGLWVLSLQFLEVISSASYLLPMMSDLLSDIWNFFILFGVFQLGLTLTFYQLFRGHGDDAFGSLGQSFMTTYFVAFGQVPLDSLSVFSASDNSSSSQAAMYTGVALLMMLHSAIVVVVLLNVLLALMNQTVTGGLEKAKTRALMSYAQCILRLEGAMHLDNAETTALTHVKDASGKLVLHPIFSETVPRVNLVLTPDQVETLQRTGASRMAWLDQMRHLDKVVKDQIGFVVDGLDHVSHFTDLNVHEIFAREFELLATAQQQLLDAIEMARRSRGYFKKEILAKLEKQTTKKLRELSMQLVDAWTKDGFEPSDDHDKCAMLYQINQRTTFEAVVNKTVSTIAAAVSDAATRSLPAVDTEKEDLRRDLSQLQSSMEAMAKQMETMLAQHAAMMTQQDTMLTHQDAMQAQQRELLSLLTNTESRSTSPTASIQRVMSI
ncbi:hypothetical protein SDRG_12902 [Saprolegnia diclina VS20]|uniref:Ion transport domain-containing protein n=1 Tax=Saprolegnia diclina (strain VS20) TaxID=1156394 RepID=T0Q7K4_SAPDV|nr:hypothetical protein SDRG_12902 [Saprolegnia diclina VS20]EQC29440.1 hypothetical protein SDRG_12902 [Saprolegnia diclina VS20]|eukprot:XP_008617207.1 hypothetical protein SDRG_12902 [Saprolegnia diclina VS20]